jgi:hypothetical protein
MAEIVKKTKVAEYETCPIEISRTVLPESPFTEVETLLLVTLVFGSSSTDHPLLDPCTGTGNFVVNLLRRVPKKHIASFYADHLYANEIMLMAYYIAVLNIDHAYYHRVPSRWTRTHKLAWLAEQSACLSPGTRLRTTSTRPPSPPGWKSSSRITTRMSTNTNVSRRQRKSMSLHKIPFLEVVPGRHVTGVASGQSRRKQ